MRVEGSDERELDAAPASPLGLNNNGRQERIFVSVRLRPLNSKEIQSNDFADWECISNTTIFFKNCLGERSMYPNAYHFGNLRHRSSYISHLLLVGCITSYPCSQKCMQG